MCETNHVFTVFGLTESRLDCLRKLKQTGKEKGNYGFVKGGVLDVHEFKGKKYLLKIDLDFLVYKKEMDM